MLPSEDAVFDIHRVSLLVTLALGALLLLANVLSVVSGHDWLFALGGR
jgi:hypothetical protein